jgi:hypothetical protein
VEELGAAGGSEGVEALPKAALQLVGTHGRSLAASYARLRRVVVVFDTVQCVILRDGVGLPLGDVGLQEVAPANEADEDVEQDRLDAADEDLQVPVPLLMQEMPEGLPMLGLEPEPPSPEEDVDAPQDHDNDGESHDKPPDRRAIACSPHTG